MNLLSSFSGTFSFGDMLVDVGAHTLQRGQDACVLEPKAFRVLLELLGRPGDVITKDELLDSVWGHRAVTPNVLSRAITQIRHAIGDTAHHSRYIETVPTLGYRFIASVRHERAAHDASVFSGFDLNRDPAYSMALLDELNRLLDSLNGQHTEYPALSRHLSMLAEMFGNKPSGMVLYELALEYGLEKLNSLDLDLPWRHKNPETPDAVDKAARRAESPR
jgi:DNA-binding winged helix-turn-helix (wHTH) protein